MVGLRDEVARSLRRGLEAAHPLLEDTTAGPGGGLADVERIGSGSHVVTEVW
jgi:hypothetical protein